VADPAPDRVGGSAAERAAAYRWLSGLFARPPDAAALAVYAGPGGAALLDALAADPALAPAAEALRARARAPDRAAAALRLAGAFEWLFSGQAGPRTASPYASVHTSPRGLTHQQAMADAARDLAALDLHVDGLAEPPDHIAVLLAAMGEIAARGEPAAVQADFLDRHLIRWIGGFRDDCRAFDRDGFHAAVAAAADDFIRADRQRLMADAG
jgi:TorA maturation chaperone TorD